VFLFFQKKIMFIKYNKKTNMSDFVDTSTPPLIPADIEQSSGQFNNKVTILGDTRIAETSSTLLAFYGVTGATQARNTISTGSWTAVANKGTVGPEDVFFGYTIGQVVTALKNVGILG
jgi:hypothetical protein